MKINIYGFENEIVINKNGINVLEIEDKKLFRNMVTLFYRQSNAIDKSNEIVLKDSNEERMDISNEMYFTNDILNIDFNDKKILNKIYAIIDNNVKNREDYELEKINLNLRNYLISEINELPFEFTIKDEINIIDLLKNYSLKFDEICYNDIIEKIEFLIDIISFLKIAKILVLVNIKTFFDEEELKEIYKYACYHNINLLLIENCLQVNSIDGEIKNIIDKEFDDMIKT